MTVNGCAQHPTPMGHQQATCTLPLRSSPDMAPVGGALPEHWGMALDRSTPNLRAALTSRRSIILGAAATVVAAGCSSSKSDSATSPSSPSDRSTTTDAPTPPSTTSTDVVEACRLTPELTAGPYYLDGHLARCDITEGRPGTPLQFQVTVMGIDECTPLQGAAVDIWHCDAGGEYSGFNGNSLAETQAQGANDKRYLRGVQLTDADGTATFSTIFPGWYEGRTVHIHLKVLEGGALSTTYTGGHVAHVGQAFFDEDTTAHILARSPYSAHTGTRTTNAQDSIYAQAGTGAIAAMTPHAPGYRATFVCTVDPASTPPAAPLF